MKKILSFPRNRIALTISLAAASASLYAQDNHILQTPQGQPIFDIRFYDLGDGPYTHEGDKTNSSTWTMNALQKQQILQGFEYWANVIKPQPGILPVIFNVGTNNEKDNASAESDPAPTATNVYTSIVQAALMNQPIGELDFGSHGRVNVGPPDATLAPYTPSQTPVMDNGDELVSTGLHELAHALGITSSAENKSDGKSITPYFAKTLSNWTAGLHDDNGNAARPEQAVLCTGCDNSYSSDAFDVRKDQGYFSGEHVSEVLAGAMPGIPVKMLGSEGEVDDNYMSHIELKNSLMSHQDYRNYNTFMEAELAALQDMGYQIDRRNFFGYSVYGNDQTLYNQHGYYQRDPSGTHYLVGAYSTTQQGLGLHVYGSNNLIHQQADLLTQGAGAAGVRIDGASNTLVVDPGTRIHADGLNGRGVLFAYGINHDLIQRGDIQALGEKGIAAEFDFGGNMLGNRYESRGSYIHTVNGKPGDLLPELKGALVNTVDISGRLAGRSAAISISSNALVGAINVLSGAKLEGNILSAYDQKDENDDQRLTQLTFGLLADGEGRATDQANPNFQMTYDGNIVGINNLALELRGGETSLGGQHQLYSVNVEEGATLRGNGQFQLNPNGEFVNRGTVAPGNSLGRITVDGDYRQTGTGQLL
ncbi:hypothetical protein, partial [Pseudomonas sp.]|uniref:hypothetical protein n=1 Tax=Pseudomonas sp. TaxID=306 RepID=UPI002914161D